MQITAGLIKAIYPQYKYPADLAEVLNEQFEKYDPDVKYNSRHGAEYK